MNNNNMITPNWQPQSPPRPAAPQARQAGAQQAPGPINSQLPPPPTAPPPQQLPPQQPVPELPQPRAYKKWLWAGLAALGIVVLVVLIGLYIVVFEGKTVLGEKLQDHVWKSLIRQKWSQTASRSFSYTYQDTEKYEFVPSRVIQGLIAQFPDQLPVTESDLAEIGSYDQELSFTLDRAGFSVGGSGYVNFNNPQFDLAGTFNVFNQGKTYGLNGNAKLTQQAMFFRYAFTQDLFAFLESKGDMFPSDGIESIKSLNDRWLKTALNSSYYQDIKEGFEGAGSCAEGGDCQVSEVDNDFQELLQLIENNRFVYIDSFRGVSLLHGKPVLRYRLAYDNDKVRHLTFELFKLSIKDAGFTDKEMADAQKFFDQLYAPPEFTMFDVWVGAFDRKVYKLEMETKTVSVAGMLTELEKDLLGGKFKMLIEALLGSARSKSQDAKRLADMRQMAVALDLYFNDNGGYPAGGSGKPQGLDDYLFTVPEPPTPPGGGCSDFYNNYWYTPQGAPLLTTNYSGQQVTVYPNYSYTFCLGELTGGFGPGDMELTAAGIAPLNNCTNEGACYNASVSAGAGQEQSAEEIQQAVLDYAKDFYARVPKTATSRLEYEVWDIGVEKTVTEPDSAIDLEAELQRRKAEQDAEFQDYLDSLQQQPQFE